MRDGDEGNDKPAGVFKRVRRMGIAALGAAHTRGQLFQLELQEEAQRLVEIAIWATLACLMGVAAIATLTGVIIFLCPAGARIYAAAGFVAFYLACCIFALLNLRAHLKTRLPPFSGTLEELKKDQEWFESFQ